MRKLTISKKYINLIHKEGSTYEFEEHDDDGLHLNYIETDAKGFTHWHKVLIKDRNEWDQLCKLYPRVSQSQTVEQMVGVGDTMWVVEDCDGSCVLSVHFTEEEADKKAEVLRNGFPPSVIFRVYSVMVG